MPCGKWIVRKTRWTLIKGPMRDRRVEERTMFQDLMMDRSNNNDYSLRVPPRTPAEHEAAVVDLIEYYAEQARIHGPHAERE